MKVVYDLPPKTRYGTMALDLEIFRARKTQLHRPYGDFASLGISDGKTVWMIENVKQVEKALRRIEPCRWVFHNASFDLRHLRRWADVPPRPIDLFWDTQLIDMLLWGGWYDRFGLRDLSRRYLEIQLDKETRNEYATATELTAAMRRYAAKDPWVTARIYEAQRPLLEADPPSEHVWKEIDGPMLWAVIDFHGIYLDQGKWRTLAENERRKADELEAKLGFNPASPAQTRQALEKKKIFVTSTREEFLLPYRGNPLVDKIFAFREAETRASRYGENILAMVEPDGYIYANFKVTGAETGRTACEGPNIQNQPNENDYRSCYIAGPGGILFSYDYSRQEPGVMAELSRDPELMRALAQGENVHLSAGRLVFDNPNIQEKDKHGHKTKEYRIAKALNLGLSYGMTARGLAKRTGVSTEEAERLVARYFLRMRGIRQYIDRYRALGRQDGFVRSLGGRRIWLNWYGYQAGNNAINGPMQGTGADMIKLATVKLHRHYQAGRYGEKFPIIGPIHDELLAETCKKLRTLFAKDLQQAMETAFHELCPNVVAKTIVDKHIGHSWAGKE